MHKGEEIDKLEQFFRDPDAGDTLIKPGMSGKACENIRHALRLLGYDVEYGNQYDDALAKAILKFQTDNNHQSRDGFFGPGTRKLLVDKLIEARHTYIFQRMRTPEMNYLEEKIAYFRELSKIKLRRKDALELQKASFGLHTPPHITIEIEDIVKEIEQHRQMIEKLEKEFNLAKAKIE